MQFPVPEQGRNRRIWRYLTFGRFLWLLQKKMLWLSRADRLNDSWETSPSPAQVAALMAMAAPETGTAASPYKTDLDALRGLASVVRTFPRFAYVNCWIEAEHESFGMWRTYGRIAESLAIQTTIGRLTDSVPRDGFEVLPVRYDQQADPRLGGQLYFATQKRPMFAYEHEVRIIYLTPPSRENFEKNPAGVSIPWDPAEQVENVYVHPEADDGFFETVVQGVRQFAPALENKVHRSQLTDGPETVFFAEAERLLNQFRSAT